MNIQSWTNQQEEISARKERTANRVMNAVFVFATAVMVFLIFR